MLARESLCAVQLLGKAFIDNFVYKRGLARTRNSGYTDKFSERNFYIYIIKIILCGALDLKELTVALSSFLRHGNFLPAAEILTCY